MPKLAAHKIVWTPASQRYEVSERKVWGMAYPGVPFAGQEWLTWLERVPSFAFRSKNGHRFTARKERRARGSDYWIAYRRGDGQLRKKYLGPSQTLTLEHMEQIAEELERSVISPSPDQDTPIDQARASAAAPNLTAPDRERLYRDVWRYDFPALTVTLPGSEETITIVGEPAWRQFCDGAEDQAISHVLDTVISCICGYRAPFQVIVRYS